MENPYELAKNILLASDDNVDISDKFTSIDLYGTSKQEMSNQDEGDSRFHLENEAIDVIKNYDMIIDYKDAILFVVNYIDQNEHILKCALDSIGREELKRFLVKDFDEITYTMNSSAEKELGAKLDESHKKFITSFYTEALAGILIEWIKNKKERNKDNLIDYISKTVKNSLTGILQNN